MNELIRDKEIELDIKRRECDDGTINVYTGDERAIFRLCDMYGEIANYEAEYVILFLTKKWNKYSLIATYWIEDDSVSEDIVLNDNIGYREMCKVLEIIAGR